jgi:hypothetical protein
MQDYRRAGRSKDEMYKLFRAGSTWLRGCAAVVGRWAMPCAMPLLRPRHIHGDLASSSFRTVVCCHHVHQQPSNIKLYSDIQSCLG